MAGLAGSIFHPTEPRIMNSPVLRVHSSGCLPYMKDPGPDEKNAGTGMKAESCAGGYPSRQNLPSNTDCDYRECPLSESASPRASSDTTKDQVQSATGLPPQRDEHGRAKKAFDDSCQIQRSAIVYQDLKILECYRAPSRDSFATWGSMPSLGMLPSSGALPDLGSTQAETCRRAKLKMQRQRHELQDFIEDSSDAPASFRDMIHGRRDAGHFCQDSGAQVEVKQVERDVFDAPTQGPDRPDDSDGYDYDDDEDDEASSVSSDGYLSQ
eukprot:gb/GFBE01050183.1/.p1 GENE.gb/GFBE01050183.1/~~gb/GFBE01050183.1/.p1  ORF type:complete len:268 (+),score=30.00 gb/GFBE01050183.1/:1-804(+)